MCRAFLVDAKWYRNGYTPTLDEFLGNGWISIGIAVILKVLYCVLEQNLALGSIDFIEKSSEIFKLSGTMVRFADDLGTSAVRTQLLQ